MTKNDYTKLIELPPLELLLEVPLAGDSAEAPDAQSRRSGRLNRISGAATCVPGGRSGSDSPHEELLLEEPPSSLLELEPLELPVRPELELETLVSPSLPQPEDEAPPPSKLPFSASDSHSVSPVEEELAPVAAAVPVAVAEPVAVGVAEPVAVGVVELPPSTPARSWRTSRPS